MYSIEIINLAKKYLANNCHQYIFEFSSSNSFREVLFAPIMFVSRMGGVIERTQEWIIDNGEVYPKSLRNYISEKPNPLNIFTRDSYIAYETSLFELLDQRYFVQSIAGIFFYISMTSIKFRIIELFGEGIENFLNFTTSLSPKAKEILHILIPLATIGCIFWSGHDFLDTTMIASPIIFGKILSFSLANFFKGIINLSNSKDLVLRNFIIKNVQSTFIHMLPAISFLILSYARPGHSNQSPQSITICQIKPSIFIERGISIFAPLWLALFELLMMSASKMFFDFGYILLLKMLIKDVDLRDPLGGCVISRLSKDPISKIEFPKEENGDPLIKETVLHREEPLNEPISEIVIPSYNYSNKPDKDESSKQNISINSRSKKETTHKEPVSLETTTKKANTHQEKIIIKIKFNGQVRTFYKLYANNFKKPVWAVIFADSVEKQTLEKYEQCLSNGHIGGSIRPLKNQSGCYELRSKIDSRLIGKMYNVFDSLQEVMSRNDAYYYSKALESSISDDALLIVFFDEAKSHKGKKGIYHTSKKL